MSEYQRFVSYLYEYKNNQKMQNRGFLKAESRNGSFKLEIHIKDAALSFGIPVEIYGYTRIHDALFGILLGSTQSGKETIHCQIEASCALANAPDQSFSDLKGIILLCNGVFSYASAWDDLLIDPQTFTTSPEPDEITESIPDEPSLTVEEVSTPAENILSHYESFDPFSDGFISECVKIGLKDLPSLQQNGWSIGLNPLIAHAYDEHQHLLLGHIVSENQDIHILGIPGTYHPKEKFMAQMYGFPYFKAANTSSDSVLPFGYWYRPLS